MDSVKDILGGAEVSKPAKKIKHITHRRTTNGGHVFEHHHTHPEHHESEEHSYSKDRDAIKHFIQNGTSASPDDIMKPEEAAPAQDAAPINPGTVPGV